MKKVLIVLLALVLIGIQSVAACTIFAVGKAATTDGSTMISHTCDSNSDDLRVWLIPAQEAGFTRDIVKSGRAGSDFSNFPEIIYGSRATVMGEYTAENGTNAYVHGMYSFMNDKGLAMGESTCSRSRSDDRGLAATLAFQDIRATAKWDCYALQDAALENCATAREAVEFMGKKISEEGWADGSCECINICDGNESWVFEAYGANQWAAIRVPDDMVFVAANRARINVYKENDPDYICSPTLKSWAIEQGLWNGEGNFEPCNVYAWNGYNNMGCTLREWRAINLLNPEVGKDLDPFGDCNTYPLFVKPAELVSVQTIKDICSDYYAGTKFDLSKTVEAGEFGNVLYNYHNTLKQDTQVGIARPINMFRATYVQIANVKAWLPAEARCLVWVGWGAPSTCYLTPVFASANSFPEQFGRGTRAAYDPKSAWWNQSFVQQMSQINYQSAIKDIEAVRNPIQDQLYISTAAAQEVAASLVEAGRADLAKSYITSFMANAANVWFDTYEDLGNKLVGKYMNGTVNFSVPARPQEWIDIILANMPEE
ncbi:MAG: C69 family dipeptidase [Spirochaetales bacterium]|nr:C69 family dipeptidase [Spirochaetales bacterium]